MGLWGRVIRVVIGVLVVGAAVVGVRISSADSQTYTGCLSADGALSRVAIGDAPTKPCGSLTQVSWTSDPPPGEPGTPGKIDVQSCPTGEAVMGFNQNGGIFCAVP